MDQVQADNYETAGTKNVIVTPCRGFQTSTGTAFQAHGAIRTTSAAMNSGKLSHSLAFPYWDLCADRLARDHDLQRGGNFTKRSEDWGFAAPD
jgi:hypothetical protein